MKIPRLLRVNGFRLRKNFNRGRGRRLHLWALYRLRFHGCGIVSKSAGSYFAATTVAARSIAHFGGTESPGLYRSAGMSVGSAARSVHRTKRRASNDATALTAVPAIVAFSHRPVKTAYLRQQGGLFRIRVSLHSIRIAETSDIYLFGVSYSLCSLFAGKNTGVNLGPQRRCRLWLGSYNLRRRFWRGGRNVRRFNRLRRFFSDRRRHNWLWCDKRLHLRKLLRHFRFGEQLGFYFGQRRLIRL